MLFKGRSLSGDILKAISEKNEEKVALCISDENSSLTKIVKLVVDNNVEDSKIIENYFTNKKNDEVISALSAKLEEINYPNFIIRSTDDKSEFSIFSQCKAAYFYAGYQHEMEEKKNSEQALDYLDQACEAGSYDAWLKKLIYLKEEFNQTKDPDSRKILLEGLIKSSLDFGEKFWTAGHLNAGIILLDVANYYKDDKNLTKILMAAMKSFYLGYYLHDNADSQKILKCFYRKNPEENLIGDWPDIFRKVKSWNVTDFNSLKIHLLAALDENFGIEIDKATDILAQIEKTTKEEVDDINKKFDQRTSFTALRNGLS